MDVAGVGRGYLVAAVGGVVLLASLLFLNWYSVGEAEIAPIEIGANLFAQAEPIEIELPEAPEENFGAWESQGFLGTLANLVMLAAGAWAIAVAAMRAAGSAAIEEGAAAALTAGLGLAAVAMVVLRIIFPVEEIGGFEFDANLEFGIFVALAGAVLIAVGGLLARGEVTPGYRPPPPPPAP
jgi:hypothetical protein